MRFHDKNLKEIIDIDKDFKVYELTKYNFVKKIQQFKRNEFLIFQSYFVLS